MYRVHECWILGIWRALVLSNVFWTHVCRTLGICCALVPFDMFCILGIWSALVLFDTVLYS